MLIAHAEDDWDIPYAHSEVIFDAFLEPYLPEISVPQYGRTLSIEDWAQFKIESEARSDRRSDIVQRKELRNFGTVEEFEAEGKKVVLVKTLAGGHDYLGVQEGVQDMIRTSFGLV